MKKMFFVIAIMFVSFITITTVNAATTSYTTAPSLLPEGSTVSGAVHSLTGSTNTAKGSNCKAYFTIGGTISVDLASWSNRVLTMALWEDDFTGGDDKIKVYKGGFTGRELTSVSVNSTLITGDVEASDDATAELYLTFYINKNSEDKTGEYTGKFFQYKLENA